MIFQKNRSPFRVGRLKIWLIAIGLFVFSIGISAIAAQQTLVNYKLSAEEPSDGGVKSDFQISPDGQHAVYIDYQSRLSLSEVGGGELFSVPLNGSGTPIRLSKRLPEFVSVRTFSISPNSEHVIYRVNQDSLNQTELYSVPIEGGEIVKLNHPLEGDGFVRDDFQISPNSNFVVFRVFNDTNNLFELYTVPIEGGEPTRLDSMRLGGGEAGRFQISPDGETVVYIFEALLGADELFAGPIDGSTSPTSILVLEEDQFIKSFDISSNSEQLVFITTNTSDSTDSNLFSIPLEGGTATTLNQGILPITNVFEFKISPDSGRVAYLAELSNLSETAFQFQLFSVSIDGGFSSILNGSLGPDGDVSDFEFSSDSNWIIYTADQDNEDNVELYTVSLTSGDREKLNGLLTTNGNVNSFDISPDSKLVVYRADQQEDEKHELFLARIEGGTDPEKLNGPLVENGDVWSYKISPRGDRVIYGADQEQDQLFELFSVPVEGGEVEKLNNVLVNNGEVSSFQFSSDGDTVVYAAIQEVEGRNRELFASFINQPPSIDSPISAPQANVGNELVILITATDPNASDTLTISATEKPSWLTLTNNGDGTASLAGTPTASDRGSHTVTVEVTDTAGATASTTFNVEVVADSFFIYLPIIRR